LEDKPFSWVGEIMIIFGDGRGRGLLGKTPRVALPKSARLVYSGFTREKAVCDREMGKDVDIKGSQEFLFLLTVY
jgi:hypothetical protein